MYSKDFSAFVNLPLTYWKLLVKDQSSFYKICNIAFSMDIKIFNWTNSTLLNILKTLEIFYNTFISQVNFFLWIDTWFFIAIHFWVFLFICFLSQSSHKSVSFRETKISSICESYCKDKKNKVGKNPDASWRHWTKETRNSI